MDTLEIWEKGVPLSQTFTCFGDKAKVAEYQTCRAQSSAGSMLERMQQNVESGITGWDILKGVTEANAPERKRADTLEKELKDAVLSYVQQGLVVAYGYSHPRHADDQPQKVPDDLWSYIIYWDKDRLQHNGLRMDAVRLIPIQWLNDSPEAEHAPAGRPSRKPQIIEGFHALAQSGQIDFSKPANHCYETVRQWVKANYPEEPDNDRGLGDKTMANTVNPLFKEEKRKI